MAPQPNTYVDPYQWLTINDFSPGIISNSNFAYGAGAAAQAPVPVARMGQGQAACRADHTVNCIALPNGGLGPLPGVAKTVTDPNAPGPAYLNGTLAYGPISQEFAFPYGGDELLFSYEWYVGGVQNWQLNALQVFPANGGQMVISRSQTYSDINAMVACSLILTEVMFTTTPDNVGYPRVIGSHSTLSNTSNYPDTFMYPQWASPNLGGTTSMSGVIDIDQPMWLVGHQNRVVGLMNAGTTNMAWRVVAPFGSSYFYAAEVFNYTDPPNSVLFGGQQENFVQENPTAHGAWGSISASELFLVRHQGGGYVIAGDLNNPTVTRLPGVTGTNGSVQVAAQTPIGLVYGSANNGVWVWNGGNASVKLSPQLNDDFFMLTYDQNIMGTGWTPQPNGPLFNFNTLGDLIYCPNNWVYSTTLNSWWQWTPLLNTTGNFILDSPTQGILDQNLLWGDPSGPMVWFWPTFDGTGMWAFPQYILSALDTTAYQVSRKTPVATWTWQSYPVPLSQNQQVQVRKIAVRGQGVGTITVALHNPEGEAAGLEPVPFTFSDPNQPVLVQASAGARGTDLTFTITAAGSGGGPAPVLYEVSVAYELAQQTNPT